MLHRPPVLGRQGAISTSHPQATAAGAAVLARGGTAVDALVAAGAVLAVVEPSASGLGGDAFFLVHRAGEGEVTALNGSGAAPRALTAERFAGASSVPLLGPLVHTVPGAVSAWHEAWSRFGSGSWSELLAPAVRLAAEGYVVSTRMGRMLRMQRAVLAADAGLRGLFLHADGTARAAGEIVRPQALARSLERIAAGGPSAFYDGAVGESLVRGVAAAGGVLAREDLSAHRTVASRAYALPHPDSNRLVHEQPLPSQGIVLLLTLALVEISDELGPQASWTELHRQVEAKKIAFALKDLFLSDPAFLPVPEAELVQTLLSEEVLLGLAPLTRAEPLPLGLARETVLATLARCGDGARGLVERYRGAGLLGGESRPAGIDTTYLCAADSSGLTAGLIQSVFHVMGSGFLEPETGILLNNRAVGFSLDPRHVNRLEPGKRTLHTLNSYLVTDETTPILVGGTPGGDNQVQTNLQILRHLLKGGSRWPGPSPMEPGRWTQARRLAVDPAPASWALRLDEALAAPRWRHEENDQVRLESRFPAEIRRRFARFGHDAVRIGPWEGSGLAQLIHVGAGPVFTAATDPRGEGVALAL